MRRFTFVALVLVLASVIHVDWHFARPTHHRLSLGWQNHWVFAALAFAFIGWIVARVWPTDAWRRGSIITVLAVLLAQGLEPMAEVALNLHRLGYPNEPGRLAAFGVCLAAGLPAFCLALWLCRPRTARRTSPSIAPAA